MSFAARAGIVTAAVLIATVGCDSAFRFDEPATSAKPDGSADESSADGGSHAPCTDDTTCSGLRCQLSTGTCVACVGDTDCTGTRRHCDVAQGICVECNATTDCPMLPGSLQGCDTITKRCLDLCHDDDDLCPGLGFACKGTSRDGSSKLCIECTTSKNCAGSQTGPVCDVPIGRCVECTGNAQCPSSAKPVCDRRTGRCEACVTSVECGMGSVCDPGTLTCRQLP